MHGVARREVNTFNEGKTSSRISVDFCDKRLTERSRTRDCHVKCFLVYASLSSVLAGFYLHLYIFPWLRFPILSHFDFVLCPKFIFCLMVDISTGPELP